MYLDCCCLAHRPGQQLHSLPANPESGCVVAKHIPIAEIAIPEQWVGMKNMIPNLMLSEHFIKGAPSFYEF